MTRLFAILTVALALAGCAVPTSQDGQPVRVTGPIPDAVRVSSTLSDDNFYRLVACAASPGRPCRKPVFKFPASKARSLGVAVVRIDADVRPAKKQTFAQVLPAAIAQINGAGAGVKLRMTSADRADIRIFFIEGPLGGIIRNTGSLGVNGVRAGAGNYRLHLNGDGTIRAAGIALNGVVRKVDMQSVLLEELVQALGLGTDIDGAAYQDKSIFSETSNSVKTLRGQDLMALRRHYPK